MHYLNRLNLFIVSILLCVASSYSQDLTPEKYIEIYRDIAIHEMNAYKIPASITLAQGLLESANGNSRLAVQANNHFGIKCHKGWSGEKIFHDDDAKDECFRKYKSAHESYEDHSKFLTTRSRYASLFDLELTDYKGWAKGLKKAGYATSPIYADKLIEIIERYKLNEYDDGVYEDLLAETKEEKPQPSEKTNNYTLVEDFEPVFWNNAGRNIFRNNGVKCTIVRKDDNLEKIAKDLELGIWQLKKYNELDESYKPKLGYIIYLQPKKKKSKKEFHMVQEGETMHSISQKYAIKLNQLYKKNLMAEGTEPVLGQQIWLKKKKEY